MQRISITGLIEQTTQLISLPDIVIELNNMVNDPLSSTHDFSKLIQIDPALTLKLLKIVNSPYYNMPSHIDNIATAVTIIGTKELRDLILASSMLESFNGFKNNLCSLENFWRHSTYTAVVARKLAESRREPHAERFFTAGLLHDIGSLILYRQLPEQSELIIRRAIQNEIPLHETEEEVLGFTSADLGGQLAHEWNLPGMLENTIRYHNHPERSNGFEMDSSIIYVANHLANMIDITSNRLQAIPAIEDHYWDTIELSPEMFISARPDIIQQFEEITRLIINDAVAA